MSWISHFADRQLAIECGRLLLFSVSAAYVGANVRRLAVRRGWDMHFLHLSELLRFARRHLPRRPWWLWLGLGSGGGAALAVMLAMAW
jgi:hypothetical protein